MPLIDPRLLSDNVCFSTTATFNCERRIYDALPDVESQRFEKLHKQQEQGERESIETRGLLITVSYPILDNG